MTAELSPATTNLYGYEARENLMEMEMEMEEEQLYEAIDNGSMEMMPFDMGNCIWGLDQQPSTSSPSQPTNFHIDTYDQSYYFNLPPPPHGYTNCDDVSGGVGRGGKRTRTTTGRAQADATERERRIQLNAKYKALRNLIPNPTKADKASIVEDAIWYIKGLLARVAELKVVMEKKREGTGAGEAERIRRYRLERKSGATEVDVRVIGDQVTIKLLRRNKMNCLLYASQALEELHLDPLHVAGGHFGDLSSFWFYIKVHQGSCVCASAIADRLIQAGDT